MARKRTKSRRLKRDLSTLLSPDLADGVSPETLISEMVAEYGYEEVQSALESLADEEEAARQDDEMDEDDEDMRMDEEEDEEDMRMDDYDEDDEDMRMDEEEDDEDMRMDDDVVIEPAVVEEAVADAVTEIVDEVIDEVTDVVVEEVEAEARKRRRARNRRPAVSRRRRVTTKRPRRVAKRSPRMTKLEREVAIMRKRMASKPPAHKTRRNATALRSMASRVSAMKDHRFDHLSGRDMMAGAQFMRSLQDAYPGKWRGEVSEAYKRTMLHKLAREIEQGSIIGEGVQVPRSYTRADQVGGASIAGFGQEWVGELYSTDLWETVRQETRLIELMTAKGMMEREIPQGYDKDHITIEGADPQWFVAGEVAATDTGTGQPNAKLPSKAPGTAKTILYVYKIGASSIYSGELEEDSLIPFLPQLRRQTEISASEMMERVIINGDKNVALPNLPTTPYNLNSYHGTPATGQVSAGDYGSYPDYTLINGLFKLALITAGAPQAIAGGAITETTYRAMLRYLGTKGKLAKDLERCLWIVDNLVYLATLDVALLKQAEKTGVGSTVIDGTLEKIWGIDMYRSAEIDLADAAGYIDIETAGNNIYGRIGLVRPDRFAFGWKRRTETETTRWSRADAFELVTWMRWGFVHRDENAAVVTYGVEV